MAGSCYHSDACRVKMLALPAEQQEALMAEALSLAQNYPGIGALNVNSIGLLGHKCHRGRTEPMLAKPLPCDRCRNNTRNPHLRCTIHPTGMPEDQKRCPDFEPDPNGPPSEWWEPVGASFYGDELIITPTQRWTRAQQLALLDWHPLFTGRCPHCERSIVASQLQPHLDCSDCGWQDDTL